ncbi:LOW QUALITY PROTEIN: hyaluronidase-like [Chelonus insularis]|uniref:LOW QUALITY PROTEIN: hyaluronidase-like n=1 Tax=Chelonus insularis TaxID=460826 RepID=UPI00158E5CC0|nr:LOW QUALITY PROTEIN: hyaluronidase-like [Chelonus insularis]
MLINMTKVFIILLFLSVTKATLWGIEQVSHDDPDSLHMLPFTKFQVYWNVPTFMCHQYGIFFNQVFDNFEIIQNSNDTFLGNNIAILYDPGFFPALLKNSNGTIYIRNGGVPQEGNLHKHLEMFKAHVQEQVDYNFSGLGIIDFESWRPIFRQNWGSLAHYRDYSYKIEEKRHPFMNEKIIKRLATKRFEDFAKIFMEETINLAKYLRPNAYWSYYGYPQCFNLTPKQPNTQCDNQLRKENDEISWLWERENALLPSIYFPRDLDVKTKVGLINGRLNEAWRIAKKFKPQPKILPYFWYKYRDSQDTFLSYNDLIHGFQEILNQKVNGFVIWGSSNDVNTQQKCFELRNYLNNILGPLVKQMIDIANQRNINTANSITLER